MTTTPIGDDRVRWDQKLNKKEKAHLRKWARTKADFKRQVDHMKKEMEKDPNSRIICWDCRMIAEKLGMWGA